MEYDTYFKYLGVLIDENLSWKNYLDCIITKISKTIGMIAKLRHFVPTSVLTNSYKFLILPYLSYGFLAWGNASKNYLNKMFVLQKRILRLIYFVDRKQNAIPLIICKCENSAYYLLIAQLAERSPMTIQNSTNSNPSSRNNLVVRPYDRTTVQGATFSMRGQPHHGHYLSHYVMEGRGRR